MNTRRFPVGTAGQSAIIRVQNISRRQPHEENCNNQSKGWRGKTTTTINLSAALAEKGYSTLIVDLDPQGNASTGLGVEVKYRVATTYDLILSGKSAEDCIVPTEFNDISIIPATTDLSSADIDFLEMGNRSRLLQAALVRSHRALSECFDFILFDCPPSLGLLTVNALVAADSVLIPYRPNFLRLKASLSL